MIQAAQASCNHVACANSPYTEPKHKKNQDMPGHRGDKKRFDLYIPLVDHRLGNTHESGNIRSVNIIALLAVLHRVFET